MASLGLFIIMVMSTWHLSYSCPFRYCQCSSGWAPVSVRCNDGTVSEIVSNLPANTGSLELFAVTIGNMLSQTEFDNINVPTLQTLKVSKSYIQTIKGNTFNKFSNLRTLNLTGNNIRTIEKEAFKGLTKLGKLDLSYNDIQNIGEIFLPLNNLKELNLRSNKINTIPEGSFLSQSYLGTLILDKNEIQSFMGSTFQGLDSLRHLSLRGCELNSITSELLAAFKSVNVLDLGENNIYSLPSSDILQHHAPGLHELHLDHNSITMLNAGQFFGMTFKVLDLSYNRISKITKDNFGQCNIEILDLSANSIIQVENNAFSSMGPRLQFLSLAYNSIQKLPVDAFSGLYVLRTLNLSSISLTQLEEKQFDSVNHLSILDLSKNSLQYIPYRVFQSFQYMAKLYLQENKWHCDCNIKPFRQWLEYHRNLYLLSCGQGGTHHQMNFYECQHPKCFTPNTLFNQQIQFVQDSQIEPCTASAASGGLSIGAIVGIAIACVVICIIIGIVIFLCWRRSRGKPGFIPCKGNESVVSSHKEDFDKGEKQNIKPFSDDQMSLQSDKSFVVRHYFQTMVSVDPSVTTHNSPERMRKDTFRSNFSGSNPSLASASSYSYPMGRETAI